MFKNIWRFFKLLPKHSGVFAKMNLYYAIIYFRNTIVLCYLNEEMVILFLL